jgi:hypothetical protein
MKASFILILLFIMVSCSTQDPRRKIASEDLIIKLGNIDHTKSLVRLFPSVSTEDSLRYYFYLQLRDETGSYVDCDPSEVSLVTKKGKKIPFELERLFKGRYYLTLDKPKDLSSGHLDILVQGKPLQEQLKLSMRPPVKENTSIKVIENSAHKLRFRLRIADKRNQPVELPYQPDIMLEGIGNIEDVTHTKEGEWEFSVIYPEDNQIMYFSVRAMGVLFPKIYRYQHIEK